MFKRLEHTPYEKAKGIGHIQPGEQLNLEKTQKQLSSAYEKYIKMTVPGSSQRPSGKGTKDNGFKLKQETQTGYKELYTMRTTKEVSQKGCAICTPGLFQMNESLHNPV